MANARRPLQERAAHLILPSKKSPCLCGSGKTFKRCCEEKLPVRYLGEGAQQALREEDLSKALTECRADITQYTIWHKCHTAPLVRDVAPKRPPILDVDIKALATLVDLLFWCYIRTDTRKELSSVLERLRSNIDDPAWQRKITYFHVLCALGPEWNEKEGRRELRKLGSLGEETDLDILALHLDLSGDELPFSQRVACIDRILNLAEDENTRLHYRLARASEYYSIGDYRGAEDELDKAISASKDSTPEKARDVYGNFLLASSLSFLGFLRSDTELLDESIALYTELLRGDDWTAEGKGNLFRCLGDVYAHKSAWEDALTAYSNAVNYAPLSIYRVLQTRAILYLQGWQAASVALDAIDPHNLDKGEYIDYVFTAVSVALESKVSQKVKRAEQLLRELEIVSPHFRKQRDSELLTAIDLQRMYMSRSMLKRPLQMLRWVVRRANRYLKLEPNIGGIGVNIGNMLVDLADASKEDLDKH